MHDIHGLDVFAETSKSYLPDGLHPNAEGYRVMADRMIEQMERLRP